MINWEGDGSNVALIAFLFLPSVSVAATVTVTVTVTLCWGLRLGLLLRALFSPLLIYFREAYRSRAPQLSRVAARLFIRFTPFHSATVVFSTSAFPTALKTKPNAHITPTSTFLSQLLSSLTHLRS